MSETMATPLPNLIHDMRIIVCCGAGGVGKTTTSTGIAFAAAREGRRVLALTVDPSKRLAEVLGVDRNLREPASLPAERLAAAGIAPDMLQAWMLDPQSVADRLVRRGSTNEEDVQRLMNNRIYQQISRLVAGMQEYMAMEALHEFMAQDRYDLIVLDTPPSRNALDFLHGPSRLGAFLDGRILQLFMPGDRRSIVRRMASNLITRVVSAVFGEQMYHDLQDFFTSFRSILGVMNKNATRMVDRMKDPADVAFLMVTSPAPESVTDAFFFKKTAEDMGLPFRGFVLNRSQALLDGRVMPDASILPEDAREVHHTALEKLRVLAGLEQAQMVRDQALLADLRHHAEPRGFAVALPTLPGGANELHSLLEISDRLMSGGPAAPEAGEGHQGEAPGER